MRFPARQIVGYGINLAVIAAFAVFLVFALYKLTDIERDMRVDASENMLWVVTQAQRETLRFDTAVAHRAAGIAGEDVALRFELLLSRLKLLSDGPQARVLAALGFGADFVALSDAVVALEPLLDDFAPGDRARAQAIAERVGPLAAMLGQMANTAMVAEWNGLGARLDESRAAVWQIIGSVIGIMVSGGVLSARLIVTLRNVRRAEQSLRREKQFSELLVGSSGEGILAIDIEGRCTVWNRAMERLMEVEAQQAIGARLADISGLFAVEPVRRAVAGSLMGKPGQGLEQVFFPGAADTPRYLDLLFSPLRSGEAVVGAIAFARDVTERHAAQSALQRHRDELEELVEARTGDLKAAQAQLIAAMEDLERALERERGVSEFYRGFAAMVSHQFRTPLAIIDSNMQRLVRRGEKADAEEIAQRGARIRTAITRLTRLVEATLDAARLDTGQIEVRIAPADLCELARAACERQKETAPEREIVFQAPEGEAACRALCDPALVEHVLVNLLSNAEKYSAPDTPVTVRVGTREGVAFCAVSDKGVGVPEDEVPRLFERFFRASTASGVMGTGIGLHLSRNLARLQGGDVTVETAAGRGSTFTLSLPLAQALPEAAE